MLISSPENSYFEEHILGDTDLQDPVQIAQHESRTIVTGPASSSSVPATAHLSLPRSLLFPGACAPGCLWLEGTLFLDLPWLTSLLLRLRVGDCLWGD